MALSKEEIQEYLLDPYKPSRTQTRPNPRLGSHILTNHDFHVFGISGLSNATLYSIFWNISRNDELGGTDKIFEYCDIISEFLAACMVCAGRNEVECRKELLDHAENIIINSPVYDHDELIADVYAELSDREKMRFRTINPLANNTSIAEYSVQGPYTLKNISWQLMKERSNHEFYDISKRHFIADESIFVSLTEEVMARDMAWANQILNGGVKYAISVNDGIERSWNTEGNLWHLLEYDEALTEAKRKCDTYVVATSMENNALTRLRNVNDAFGEIVKDKPNTLCISYNATHESTEEVKRFMDELAQAGVHARAAGSFFLTPEIQLNSDVVGDETPVYLPTITEAPGILRAKLKVPNLDVERQRIRYASSRAEQVIPPIMEPMMILVEHECRVDEERVDDNPDSANQYREPKYEYPQEYIDNAVGFVGLMEKNEPRFEYHGKDPMTSVVSFDHDKACKEMFVRAITFGKLSEDIYVGIASENAMTMTEMSSYENDVLNNECLTTNESELLRMLPDQFMEIARNMLENRESATMYGNRHDFEKKLCVMQEILRRDGWDIMLDNVLEYGVPIEDALA